MKKITVVIPLGKNREFIAMPSLKSQMRNLKVLIIRGDNPSRNRNIGARKAKTEFIAFINGHTTLSDNWSNEVIKFFEENRGIDIVGGPQLTSPDEKGFAKISGYALSSLFGVGGIVRRYSGKKEILNADETLITSANLICRRRVFQKIKFDEKVYPGEDPKFISDALKNGFKVAYSNKIEVYNKRRNDLSGFAGQIFGYGKTRPKKESFLETLKRPFFLIPSLFIIYLFCLLLVGVSSLILGGKIPHIFFWPLEGYILINIAFSVIVSIKNRNFISVFLLPIIFLTIHLSYGAGFLYASVKKVLEKNEHS